MSSENEKSQLSDDQMITKAERMVTLEAAATAAQSNIAVLTAGPALSIAQSGLSLSQASSVLFANMVSNQHQQAITNSVIMGKGLTQLLSRPDKGSINVDLSSLLTYFKNHPDDTKGDLVVY
ncbi:RebB family R body protein [Kordiimonas lipolytica]|uniref:RebB family R body protein n=1 Tax=Kordiimonas lipolytica TaxID=1662421 RepID=A0ABV8U8J7_9PROT|nr:RebB family R body protein [Kordiimonas lipolytica]